MPDTEQKEQPEVKVETQPESAVEPQGLPDETPKEMPLEEWKVKAETLENKLKTEQDSWKSRVQTLATEKETLEKRLKDSQEYISRTRNLEKLEPEARPQKTFADYLGDIDQLIERDFADDPEKGLKKVTRKIVTDIAFDRDLERREYEKRLAEIEEQTIRKMALFNPDSSKILKDMEKLDQERPDLKTLTMEQKLEWLSMKNQGPKQNAMIQDQVNQERAMAESHNEIRGRSSSSSRFPAWMNDPSIQKELAEHFQSKQDMLEWLDPMKAYAKTRVAQQRNA